MGYNPSFNSFFEFPNQRYWLNTEPSNINLLFHLLYLFLYNSEMSNLLIKNFKSRISGNNTFKYLLGHPIEGVLFFFNLLIFVISTSSSSVNFFSENFLKRCTRVQKFLERNLKFFFPKEFLIVILMNKSFCCILNFVKALSNLVDRIEKL